jgi:hypothetical protein
MKVRLSHLFQNPELRAAFAAAERDQDDPDAFTVPANSPKPPRTDGATAVKKRRLCTA